MGRRAAAASLLAPLLTLTLLAGCTSGAGTATPTPSVSTQTRTRTITNSPPPPPTPSRVNTGPTTTATASSCPLLAQQSAADKVGMRLARITVSRSGGRTVGCRFYALQGSSLAVSEHLPGPNQPAVEITATRYTTAVGAQNAFVALARQEGTNLQPATIVGQAPGVCFQTHFYPKDKGSDWACTFAKGTTMVVVRTVVTSPALNAILVARAVAGQF